MELYSYFILLICIQGRVFFRISIPKITQYSIEYPKQKRNDIPMHNPFSSDDYYDQLIDIRNLDYKNNNPELQILEENDCINCGEKKPNNNKESVSKSYRSISIHNKFKPMAENKLYSENEHKTSKLFDDTDPFKEITYYMNDYLPVNDAVKYEPFPNPWSGADTIILPKPYKGEKEFNSKNRAYRYNPEVNAHENGDFILSNSQEPDEMKYKIWNALKNIRNWINN